MVSFSLLYVVFFSALDLLEFYFGVAYIYTYILMCDFVIVRKQERNSFGLGKVCGQRCPSQAHWW